MSSSIQDLIPQNTLGDTFGPLFIGVIVAAVLFGISNVQALVYFQTHMSTGITFYKLVVICLWVLDAVHLALVIHCVYYYLVLEYANISALTEILQIIFDFFITHGAHLMYIYRIWIVSKGRSKALPITVGIVVILGSGIAIAVISSIYQCHVFADLVRIDWSTYMSVALGSLAFVDIVIASSLCYLLATSRTGFAGTDSLIKKLMGYIINTGCLTSISSMAVMITCTVMPTNFTFLGLEFLVAKLYVNSFLALLNAPYYLQLNAGTSDSSELRMGHSVYRPRLHIRVSQNEEIQASRENMFKHPGDEA